VTGHQQAVLAHRRGHLLMFFNQMWSVVHFCWGFLNVKKLFFMNSELFCLHFYQF
jgi:hypothetical protein